MNSSWKQVTSGVPQRLILDLGPFKIFTNDRGGGQSELSANLQNIQNWDEWLLHQMVDLLLKGTLKGRRNGPTGIS